MKVEERRGRGGVEANEDECVDGLHRPLSIPGCDRGRAVVNPGAVVHFRRE